MSTLLPGCSPQKRAIFSLPWPSAYQAHYSLLSHSHLVHTLNYSPLLLHCLHRDWHVVLGLGFHPPAWADSYCVLIIFTKLPCFSISPTTNQNTVFMYHLWAFMLCYIITPNLLGRFTTRLLWAIIFILWLDIIMDVASPRMIIHTSIGHGCSIVKEQPYDVQIFQSLILT